MFVHNCHKRIRYAETDKMGYLYYGNYGVLYEIGRAEMLRSVGLSYREMEEEWGIMMPVLSVEARYKLPLKYDQKAKIETTLTEMPTKMIAFHHRIYDEDDNLAHQATVKLFFVDMKSNRRVSVPEKLSEKLAPYFAGKD